MQNGNKHLARMIVAVSQFYPLLENYRKAISLSFLQKSDCLLSDLPSSIYCGMQEEVDIFCHL